VRRLVGIIASLAFTASLPSTAHAYEDQAMLGLGVGYVANTAIDARVRSGIDVALSAGAGLGKDWSLQGLFSYNVLPNEGPMHLGALGVEATYALDIVRVVPLFGFCFDGVLTVRDRASRGDFALHALLGLDYLINARWSIGTDVRGFWLATHARSPLDAFILTAAVRLGLRFDLR
jgi:hypothetical protein